MRGLRGEREHGDAAAQPGEAPGGVAGLGEGHDVRLVQDYLGLRTARSVLRFVGEKPPEGADAERFSGLWGEAGGG